MYENNDLGFPSYSRTDNAVVFGTTSTAGKESVARIALSADKLTPNGTATVIYTSCKWPVWYSNAARALPARVNQAITFNAIADQSVSVGNVALQASSSAGLAVGFSVQSGPAELTGASQLKLTGTGMVVVRAFQEGNAQTFAATPVDRSFVVKQAAPTVLAIEPNWASDVRLFPNPSRSRLTIELPVGVMWQAATLVSQTGAAVQQHRNPGLVSGTLSLDMSTLATGLYVIRIDTNQGQVQRKVMRE